MKLDVVVPTYNRSKLLRAALASLLRALVPQGLDVRLIVVDNNSPDDTAATVREIQSTATLPITYVYETRQGLSNARNAGIAAATGDLVGFIDDDEEIDSDWFRVIAREFTDPKVQFIGGPYLPNWVSSVPSWLPQAYPAVIGAIPPKPRAPFDSNFGGNLMGGNSVLRKEVFERVGVYDPNLGRSSKGLLSDEDAEFYGRIRAAGLLGIYVPDLAIYHYIAPERLTRGYHRRWVYWRAVSIGSRARVAPEPATQLFGIPRYRIGSALRGLVSLPLHYLPVSDRGLAFSRELAVWDLLGFLHGRYFFRAGSFYSDTDKNNTPADPTRKREQIQEL